MRGVLRRAALLVTTATGAGVLAAGVMVVAGAGPAAAAPAGLYAAPAATGAGDCSDAADACTLSTALTDVAAGGTIELVTPGSTAHYVGNWSVGTTGTSATAQVTIEPAPGLSDQPVLDGNNGSATGCSTAPSAPCNGAVLTVPSGEFVALSGITITNGNNSVDNGSGYSTGGGLDNNGTVTITDSAFTGNTANSASNNDGVGGAIDNGDGANVGAGTLTVTDSTFKNNSASKDGGAIDNGFDGGGGTVTVTGSTFSGNNGGNVGGAIDNGNSGGGTVTVTTSTFNGNTAGFGGAISNGHTGGGTLTVTGSTFKSNSADQDGGAIDSGDGGFFGGGGGTVTVTASTFTGNSAPDGGAIDSGDGALGSGGGTVKVTASTFSGNSGGAIDLASSGSGAATVQVAGDLFDDSCTQQAGTWTDSGGNAGSDSTCYGSPPTSNPNATPGPLDLGPLADNGGPTQTIVPGTKSPAIGLIPDPTNGLCPATDQRGLHSAAGTKCDAGAVQTSNAFVLYAAAAATGAGNCLDTADACTLDTALSQVTPGGTINLVTPGSSAHYVGNWTVSTSGTTADAPVTIQAAPGLGSKPATQPVLDGNNGASTGCSTTSCDGQVLTVPGGEYVALSGITITNGLGDVVNDGAVTLTNSTVSGTSSGGGIENSVSGTVTVTDSTVSGNTGLVGGGIFNGGTMTLTDSTVSGNTADISGQRGGLGGGIANNGTMTLTDSTVSGNTADISGGGIYNEGNTVNLRGSIVAGNTAGGNPNCHNAGTLTSAGYNLTDDATGADCGFTQTGDVVGADPGLGSLADNGGPTLTMLPKSGSPAVGVIPPGTSGNGVKLCPRTDQRGVASASGGPCTIGAVEIPTIAVTVTVSGTQVYGSSTASFIETNNAPGSAVVDDSNLSCTTAGGTALSSLTAGSYTLDGSNCSGVTATGPDNYQISYTGAKNSFTVTQATPVITWANPADITWGAPLSGTQLDATASVPGTFTYTPAAGTVLGPGTGRALKASFTPTDTTDYTTASKNVTINVVFNPAACITKAFTGPLVIGNGQAYCVGKGATITNGVTVKTGGALYVTGGVIKGSVSASKAAAITLCGATVSGNVTITGATGPLAIGACGKNTMAGSVSLTSNTGGVTYQNNTVSGSLTITGNSGGTITTPGNKTTGKVTIKNNT